MIKILTSSDYVQNTFYSEGMDAIGQYTQVKFVSLDFPGKSSSTRGILSATMNGSLDIYSHQGYNRIIEHITAHFGKITAMALSPDHRFLFTAGVDGAMFIFKVSE